jgi:hypothetical protein
MSIDSEVHNASEIRCSECNEIAFVLCQQCHDEFCKDCFDVFHSKGRRKEHVAIAPSRDNQEIVKEELTKMRTRLTKRTSSIYNFSQIKNNFHELKNDHNHKIISDIKRA